MLIAETIRISLASIRSNLFRALLTMLGIIIGVGAVITMVALGTGAQRQIDDQMAALGGDILRIQASAWFSRGVARNQDTLTTDDALALMSGMEHVSAVVPEISSRFQAKFGNQNLNLQVIGTTPNYASVHGFEFSHGGMFTAADEAARRRVVVLGAEIPGMLAAKPENLVGRSIQIRSINFDIVGVLEAKGGSGWRNPDDDIWIPLSTAQFRVTGNDIVASISARVADSSTAEMAMLEIASCVVSTGYCPARTTISRSWIVSSSQNPANRRPKYLPICWRASPE